MIVGQMSLFRFPMWRECLMALASHVDALYLRLDVRGNVRSDDVMDACPEKVKGMITSDTRWNLWNWREEMLRMLDDVKPELVLSCDEDEQFGPGIENDIEYFRKSDSQQMAFEYQYPMPSVDNFEIQRGKTFPLTPHVKAFKWHPQLTFQGYKGRCRLTSLHGCCLGKSKMLHYCWYNEEVRSVRLWSNKDKMEWAQQQ